MAILKQVPALVLILFAFLPGTEAQDIDFDTTRIASDLKKNVSVVVRSENIDFEVTDISQSKLHVHRVETILNEKGVKVLYFSLQTDKFVILEDLEIKIYDASGKIIRKVKQHDLQTIAGIQEFIDDYKTYYLNLQVASYPVTMETDYRIKYKGTFNYPVWHIQKPEEGIEHAGFNARIKKDLGLRYLDKNIQLSPLITTDGDYYV